MLEFSNMFLLVYYPSKNVAARQKNIVEPPTSHDTVPIWSPPHIRKPWHEIYYLVESVHMVFGKSSAKRVTSARQSNGGKLFHYKIYRCRKCSNLKPENCGSRMAGLHASTFKPSEQSNLQNELVPFGILDHHSLHPLPSALSHQDGPTSCPKVLKMDGQ